MAAGMGLIFVAGDSPMQWSGAWGFQRTLTWQGRSGGVHAGPTKGVPWGLGGQAGNLGLCFQITLSPRAVSLASFSSQTPQLTWVFREEPWLLLFIFPFLIS